MDDDVISGAGVAVTSNDGTDTVNYFFPVTVEVRMVEADSDEIADQVLDKLSEGLDSE